MRVRSGGAFLAGGARRIRLTAVRTRADGRVENIGVVAYWHRNPLVRAVAALALQLKRLQSW